MNLLKLKMLNKNVYLLHITQMNFLFKKDNLEETIINNPTPPKKENTGDISIRKRNIIKKIKEKQLENNNSNEDDGIFFGELTGSLGSHPKI